MSKKHCRDQESRDQESRDQESRYLFATYINAEGAASRVTMWEVPADLKCKETPDMIQQIVAYFDASEKSQKDADDRILQKSLPKSSGNPFALYISPPQESEETDGWTYFNQTASKYFKEVEAPFVINGHVIMVHVADSD